MSKAEVENWDDKSFVLKQVKQNGYALMHVSARLKDDEEVVLTAVQEYGRSLIYASDRLKDNKAIVLASVSREGLSLLYSSDRLKDDEEVVLAAVKQDGCALHFSSDRLRSDIDFCIKCAKKDPESIVYFEGEAKDLFQAHNNDVVAVEQQNKANEVLLAKLSTSKITVPTNKLFKRNLLNV